MDSCTAENGIVLQKCMVAIKAYIRLNVMVLSKHLLKLELPFIIFRVTSIGRVDLTRTVNAFSQRDDVCGKSWQEIVPKESKSG